MMGPNTVSAPSVRLAVLPFEDLSCDPEQAYFSRGFAEDLITDLSKFPNLDLIASHSSFAKTLQCLDDEAVAQELDIDYLLKASIRKRSNELRLNAQLLHPVTGNILWAERFDAKAEDVFDIQDSIVEKVSSDLSKHIDSATLQAARKKPITQLAAYDCWLRGLERLHEGTLQSDEKARNFFDRALEIDPHYARAYTGLSLSYFNEWSCQLWDRNEISECLAYENANKAIKLDGNDHVSHLVLGRIYLYRRHFGRAESHLDRAITLNPNDADNLVQIGSCKSFLGKAEEGVMLFERALKLNPFCDGWYYAYGGFNHLMLRQYNQGITYMLQAPMTTVWVDLPAYMAMAYACLGDQQEAGKYLSIFLKTYQEKIIGGRPPKSGEVLQWLKHVNPFKKETDLQFMVDGMRLAGLKEDEVLSQETISVIDSLSENLDDKQSIFRSENGMRKIIFGGVGMILPEVKGYKDLEILITKPGEEFHSTDLMGIISNTDKDAELLDRQARQEYHERIRELQTELEEADQMNDIGRAEIIRKELDPLLDHLAKAVGLRGRSRALGAPSEKARSAVTWRIRNAIRKIEAAHHILGKHFQNSVRTGTFCSYRPENTIHWSV